MGIALSRLGALWSIAPLIGAALLLRPIRASRRPRVPWTFLFLLVAGFLSGAALAERHDCPTSGTTLLGHFLAAPTDGRAPFLVSGSQCQVNVVTGEEGAPAGRSVLLSGRWREGRARPWFQASSLTLSEPGQDDRGARGLRWAAVRWRASLVRRLGRQYGDRAPLVSALILARREGLAPEVRDAFATAGIAHLLAISGFHVGVVGGIFIGLLRLARLTRRDAALAASAITWLYVAFLGFPDAACRAALIMAAMALSKARGRPPARWGALGSAFLVLVTLDPSRIWNPGFQLSFAGAAGLAAWSAPISEYLARITRGRMPRSARTAVAAGVAATAATLPIVAWHFERVSLVGIPVTLLASPVVSLAVPGALIALVLDLVFQPAGAFVAGGVDSLVAALAWLAERASGISWASAWTSQDAVRVVSVGAAVGAVSARRAGLRRWPRRTRVAALALAALIAWPALFAWSGRGTVQVFFIDVGQGDAVAIRTPAARWVLIDAGPPARPGRRHAVVRQLQSRGATEIQTMVLTHPDLDHFGGALDVMAALPVRSIVDPARASPKAGYIEVLEEARAQEIPWRRAVAGQTWELDGLTFRVLAPSEVAVDADTEANASSVVLQLEWGDFSVLLTGDAPTEVERSLIPEVSQSLEVLKVGHHGSETSTDPLLLEYAPPRLAVVSVGRNNSFGHPKAAVLERLYAAGASVVRTDRDGTVVVVARADGTYRVDAERESR